MYLSDHSKNLISAEEKVAELIKQRDQLRAEVERLTAACDKFSNSEIVQGDWKARAERAEASLHALRLVCGTTDADKFSTWVDRAIARAERAEAELTFQQERNSRLFEQRDAAVEAQDKAEAALAATSAAPPPTAPSPTETRPN
jgi:hypothetical protein